MSRVELHAAKQTSAGAQLIVGGPTVCGAGVWLLVPSAMSSMRGAAVLEQQKASVDLILLRRGSCAEVEVPWQQLILVSQPTCSLLSHAHAWHSHDAP